MKKFILLLCCLLLAILLFVGVLIFVPFSTPYEKGPKTYYRVHEGAVEVFGVKNGEVRSLLAFLNPGETLTVPTISNASLKVPFWLSWIEPVVVDAVGRSRYFMYKEGKKSKYKEFTVGYTNQTIRKGFIKELERTRLLKNIQMDFFQDGFSFFAQAMGVSITAWGVASIPEGGDDILLLHLKRLKIGPFTMSEGTLRAIENLFANAYRQSGHFPIKLLQITFKENAMVMKFRKMAGSDTGILN